MKEKQVFDYREPFQAPYMIREITKNLKLPMAIAGQDIFTFMIGFAILALLTFPTIGVNQFTIIISVLLPYGLVALFNIIEPDGKKVPIFIWDYLKYLIGYQIPKWEIYQSEKIKTIKQLVFYDSMKIEALVPKEDSHS